MSLVWIFKRDYLWGTFVEALRYIQIIPDPPPLTIIAVLIAITITMIVTITAILFIKVAQTHRPIKSIALGATLAPYSASKSN